MDSVVKGIISVKQLATQADPRKGGSKKNLLDLDLTILDLCLGRLASILATWHQNNA